VKLLRRLFRRPKPAEQAPPFVPVLPPGLMEMWSREILRQAMPELKWEQWQRMNGRASD
jgi:hypothetical protein